MDHYFQDEMLMEQRQCALYSKFKDRFYSAGCEDILFARAETGTERTTHTKVRPTWARVLTKRQSASVDVRLRYNLRRVNGTWVIVQVDLE